MDQINEGIKNEEPPIILRQNQIHKNAFIRSCKWILFFLKLTFLKAIIILTVYMLLAIAFFELTTNCAPVYPLLTGSITYPCNTVSKIIETIGNNYTFVGLILLYVFISGIFYLLRNRKWLPFFIKLLFALVWIGVFSYAEIATTTTGPSLEPNFYSGIFSIYYIFEELSIFVMCIYLVKLIIRKVPLQEKIKKVIVVILIIISLPVSLFIAEIGFNAIIWAGLSFVQQTLYPPPDMHKIVQISNFSENPVLDYKTKKYHSLVIGFDIRVLADGDYTIQPEIDTGAPMDYGSSQPLFSPQPVTEGMLTGGPAEEFVLKANEIKHITFNFIPTSTLASSGINGPYYPSVEVSKSVQTISGNFSNIANITFVGNEKIDNKWNWFTYTPMLKTRPYQATDFDVNVNQ